MRSLTSTVLLFVALAFSLRAQSDISAYYTNSQVWVVWNVEPSVLSTCFSNVTYGVDNTGTNVLAFTNCLPQTYAIWFRNQPFTNTAQATLIGRLFQQEWSGNLLTGEIEDTFGVRPTGFRIPNGAGGYRTLATNQGMFALTVRSNFTGYYAVRGWGVTNVPTNYITGPVTATFSTNDPPTCHSQMSSNKNGYPIEWFTMWVDGDTATATPRPDFPFMANAARRGVAHSFFVMAPKTGGVPATNVPACVALHSGDDKANMWLPGQNGFFSVGVAPAGGYVIALEDKNFLFANGTSDAVNSRWFGWVPSFNPFTDLLNFPYAPPPWTNNLPGSNEVIQPYTLNRLNWTLDWLIAHRAIDPDRVSVLGHSGGSMGGLLWSHAFPRRFASANLYGTGLGDFPNTYFSWKMQGTREQNLATTLTNSAGQPVRARDLVEPNVSLSPERDLPFTRIFVGRRESNWCMDDDRNSTPDLIGRVQQGDTLGLGLAFFWDLREHGVNLWTYDVLSNAIANPKNCYSNFATVSLTNSWGYNDLWVPSYTNQFLRDDVAYQVRYRAGQSYPAFFNLQLRGGHGSLGAVIYTNNTVPYDQTVEYDGLVTTTECLPPWTGDKRGTWGGYFDWETNIVDTATNWSAMLFLVGPPSAFNALDLCPDSSRLTDVAIRRPQLFTPAPGSLVSWELRDVASNTLLNFGTSGVAADGLVSVPNLTIPRDPSRARLTIFIPPPVPCVFPPQLFVTLLTNSQIELRWQTCTNYDYQLESSLNLTNWNLLGPPYAASPNGWLTNAVAVAQSSAFYRVRADVLTDSPVPAAPGNYSNLFMAADGLLRSYRLFVPTNYVPGGSNAFALILHGHGQSADLFAALHPALFSVAQSSNLILALPTATATERGTGWSNKEPKPGQYLPNDVSFLTNLINRIGSTLSLDPHRTYAGGFSAGSVMCHYLGARTTNLFAALAVVEGSIGADERDGVIVTNPPAAGPMSVLLVNATNDCARPYFGGTNDEGTLVTPAVSAAYYWTNANLCAAVLAVTTNTFASSNIGRFEACGIKPAPTQYQTNQVITRTWTNCVPGTEVIFVTLTDGGHEWQNASDNVGWDSNVEVPKFFLRHLKP